MPRLQTQTLQNMLDRREYRTLRDVFSEMNEVDLAAFIGDLPSKEAVLAFRTLPKEAEMDVFAELEAETQQHIIESMSDAEAGAIIEELALDDAVDMLEELPATLVKKVLRHSTPETRAQINQFLRYPESSAGSIMTAEFTDLRRDMTVKNAIKRIRRRGEDRETIYTCYVIDDTRHLQGVVTVKDLLLAHDSALVEDLMEPEVIAVHTVTDQEEAVRKMERYDLISLPVTDNETRLVGIVTIDDAVDVIQEEATEDFERMAGMAPSERPYLRTSVFTLSRNRIVWLLVLVLSGMLTGALLEHFNVAFASFPLLISFIPMLNGAGGNAGSQSSTMVIRGIALGEVGLRDAGRVLFKELRVSVLIAVPLAGINFLRIYWFSPGAGVQLAASVSLAMICTVILANSIGGLLPMAAKALRIDPALMAAPLISTVMDTLSMLIYFSIAVAMLGIVL